MKKLLSIASLVAAAAGCGETTTLPPTQLNLDRPTDIAFACYGGMRVTNGGAASADQDVVVSAMAESSVNLALRFWLRDPHTEVPIDLEYVERVKKALDEAGIQIPYPTRSLYVERLPAGDPGPGGPADGVRGPGRPESPAGGKTP